MKFPPAQRAKFRNEAVAKFQIQTITFKPVDDKFYHELSNFHGSPGANVYTSFSFVTEMFFTKRILNRYEC